MRNLIALSACSLALMGTAGAADAPAPAKPARPSIVPPLPSRPALSQPAPAAAPLSEAAQDAADEQAEAELAAKIAKRLAILRADQDARAAAAARHRKAAPARRAAAPAHAHGTHWSYEGEHGPAHWGKINPAWAKCGIGKRQSPIDIRDGMKVNLEKVAFEYSPSPFTVVDNGHSVQVGVGPGNYLTVQGRRYELLQFHFHRPAEERVNGKGFEMVVHLVHRDVAGKLAVVALLLERGQEQQTIATVWGNLPLEKNITVAPSVVLDAGQMLPPQREYYTYMGSLTTPPCSEDVLWIVMKQPVQASPEQLAVFSRLYPLNARPVQAASGRVIKESN
ncbi:carbonic anhydrase [Massilia glaciei]|uniref:carbonic anhydrase n=1 Tax=Massilia glaciei TaxID=1524097 RepID=A0A2U2I7P6_9BURK|nr:carbonic anhydrase family protein [Massilia glaciei]PWF55719.1 carbonic anhydrase family protein [Massilia glaciei]